MYISRLGKFSGISPAAWNNSVEEEEQHANGLRIYIKSSLDSDLLHIVM